MNCLRKPNRPLPTGTKNEEGRPKASPLRSTAPRRLATKPHTSLLRLHAMSEEDLRAIHHFVRSLGPAGEPAPQALPPGQQPDTPTVDWPISTS